MLEKDKIVQAFSTWGFREQGKAGNQFYGDCPFCDKEGKFYINEVNALWDCKVCGLSGNYPKFLEKVADRNKELLGDKELQPLVKDRDLPLIAFKGFKLGKWGDSFSIPVYGTDGKIQDLRRYRIGKKMMASLGCRTGLWGMEHLFVADKKLPVFVCEGEWDGIALHWLLKLLSKPAVVVAVPGANTFKEEWFMAFRGREVYACYDNDEPGELGDIAIHKKLSGVAKFVKHLHWTGGLPTGFDVRDLIVRDAVKRKKPKKTYKRLMAMFLDVPRGKREEVVQAKLVKSMKHDPMSFEQLCKVFQKWLYLKNTDGIKIMLATVVANWIEGDPVWMFLVAPPGSAKTELIVALNKLEDVYPVSSLTPHSLISGATTLRQGDPSLIPKLHNKVLSIKDFTTIMEMRENEREEIFSILRDSYDGSCVKVFGNGVERSYKSKFGIIAGVTPVIHSLDGQNQSLGERFLKFGIEDNLDHKSEDDIINRAIDNINRETTMREEIAEKVALFIGYLRSRFDRNHLPKMQSEVKTRTVALAKFGARARGTVSRDRYRPENVESRPSSEIGSRLGKQLAKLSQAIAIVSGKKEVTKEEFRLIRKVMLDTISQKTEDVIRCVYEHCETDNDSVTTKMISAKTKYPQSTVARCLADLFMLEIVKRTGKLNKYEWSISPYIRDVIDISKIYRRKEREDTDNA